LYEHVNEYGEVGFLDCRIKRWDKLAREGFAIPMEPLPEIPAAKTYG
jgi:hypothetical protein